MKKNFNIEVTRTTYLDVEVDVNEWNHRYGGGEYEVEFDEDDVNDLALSMSSNNFESGFVDEWGVCSDDHRVNSPVKFRIKYEIVRADVEEKEAHYVSQQA